MATLYVAEFNYIGGGGNHPVQGALVPPITEQTVAIGAGATSSPFSSNTTMVRISCDTTCSIAFGASPTATTSNMRLAANQTEYFTVTPG